MIPIDTLIAWGASYKNFQKGETIFSFGAQCYYYHQLESGKVSWMNVSEEGKEFIQEIIEPGECFGEIALFDGEPYAANAVAIETCLVVRLPKNLFFQLIKENPDLHLSFSQMMARRIRYKFLLITLLAYECPEMRISTLLNYLKQKNAFEDGTKEVYQLDLTRQQLANMTGLRVETVIRVIQNLKKKGMLDIDRGKVSL
ncbi:MAG: Crp/Fnr family transcriptional regulator [Bacteroidetes bacterium]|nr:Crp/Fnr family transcriptional regulator [Bacteroidota bacterium]